MVLELERCHWATQVWMDRKPVGDKAFSFGVPHRHEWSKGLAPGKHELMILVDNTMQFDVEQNVHSCTVTNRARACRHG